MKTKQLVSGRRDYSGLLSDISVIIGQGRNTALRQVAATQALTYWLVGRRIVKFYQSGKSRADYGLQILIKLSQDLQLRFGKGYSVDNLQNMRRLYVAFPNLLKKYETASRISKRTQAGSKYETASRILSWSHYCELLKEDDANTRSFYEIEAAENGWSMRELRRQMDSMLSERLCLSKDKRKVKELSHKGLIVEKPEDAVKDPYILEFLGLKEETAYTESQLEQAIIDRLQQFLLEMGKGFTFVARQRRITIANRHYFIDLVLYNRLLKCFVLVDFKRGELTHADAGQMNLYLNYYREKETAPGENPPVGIILCSKKDEVFAKYVLGNLNNRIFASKYKLALPTEKELDKTLRIK
jgi:predicted nuclease of restriction endonuclease-like (RecB) superfamily